MKASEIAQNILQEAQKVGARIQFSASQPSITFIKTFEAHNVSELYNAEDDCAHLINLVPQSKSGSTWGTQTWTVGGQAALNSGRYCLSKSGISLRVISALKKLMGITD